MNTTEGSDPTETTALKAHAEALEARLPALRRAVDTATGVPAYDDALRELTTAEDDLADMRRRLAKRAE